MFLQKATGKMTENFELQAARPSYEIVNAYEDFMYFPTKVGN